MTANKSDREQVLSRRRALLLAAAAGAVSACPKPCLSEVPPDVCLSQPQVCLSPPAQPCPTIRWIAFSGPATSLDATATERVAQIATEMTQQSNIAVTLVARIYDDGHADTATGLNEPRIAAVEQALLGRGIAAERVRRGTPGQPLIPPPEWQQITGAPNPLTQSGLVQLLC